MIDIGKWNYETKTYDPYTPPEGNIVLYSEDMDELINCAQCGKELSFGEGYTSKEIHTSVGFGYPVCTDCYDQEILRDKESRL